MKKYLNVANWSLPHFRLGVSLGLVTFSILLIVVAATSYVYTQQKSPVIQHIPRVSLGPVVQEEIIPTPTPIIPKAINTNVPAPFITARAAYAVDMASRTPLFSYNETTPLWPASTTKLMTAMVARDLYALDDVVTISNPVAEGSIMGLVHGEEIIVEHLLHGILIQSANDAAFALADHHPAGREGFVSAMNEKVSELGLANTHFVDPAGFDNEKQYTTAKDLSILSLAALDDQVITRIVSIPSITVPDANFVNFHALTNINQLLGRVPGVGGIKTGYTENAKENLINFTKRDDNSVMTVILGSDDRFGETQLLTDWVFANYTWGNKIATESASQYINY